MCKRPFHLILIVYHTVLLNESTYNIVSATEQLDSKNCLKNITKFTSQYKKVSALTSTEEFCVRVWKWSGFMKCRKYKKIYLTKSVKKTELEEIPTCCEGWKELNETVCVKACEAGRYGDLCQNNCSCPEIGAWEKECNKHDGTCYCEAGYTGINCTQKCEDGYFGSGCNKSCACQKNSCDPRDGTCNCTIPGWKGTFCEEACDPGTYGVGCNGICNCPANASCDHISGNCVCQAGLRGWECNEVCNDFTFGEDCSYNCTCFKNNTEICDPVSGLCHCKPGWTGPYCAEICDGNTFGPKCALNCSCNLNEFCDPEHGNCYKDICYSPSTLNCAQELRECPETQQKETVSGEDKLPLFFKTLYHLCEELSSYQNREICLANGSCVCKDDRKGKHCLVSQGDEIDVTQPQVKDKELTENAKEISALIIVVGISASLVFSVLILVSICILVRRYKAKKDKRLKAVQNNGYGLVALQMDEDIIPSSNLQQNGMTEETYDRLDRNGSDRKQDREVEDSNHAGTEDTYSHATAGPDYDTTRGYLEGRETDNEYAVGGQSTIQDLHSRKDTDFDYDSVQRHKVDDVDESEYSQANRQLKKRGKDHEMSQDETYDRSENFKTRTSGTIDSDINNYSLASQVDH